jgi:hypothetical protein
MDVGWAQLDLAKFFTYSTMGLMGARSAVYPLLLLKTQLQAGANTHGESMWSVGKRIVRAQGVIGLYRGVLPVTFGVLPTQVRAITVYVEPIAE